MSIASSRESRPGDFKYTESMKESQLEPIEERVLARTDSIHSSASSKAELIRAISDKAIRTQPTPIKITFKNLNYSVTVQKTKVDLESELPPLPGSRDRKKAMKNLTQTKELQILKNCSGFALPGQTTYIMGASGAGKTSLLNLLSDRIAIKQGSKLTGEVLLNDCHPLSQNLFGRYATYVMQDDVIFPYFTIREALRFAARLKLRIPVK